MITGSTPAPMNVKSTANDKSRLEKSVTSMETDLSVSFSLKIGGPYRSATAPFTMMALSAIL